MSEDTNPSINKKDSDAMKRLSLAVEPLKKQEIKKRDEEKLGIGEKETKVKTWLAVLDEYSESGEKGYNIIKTDDDKFLHVLKRGKDRMWISTRNTNEPVELRIDFNYVNRKVAQEGEAFFWYVRDVGYANVYDKEALKNAKPSRFLNEGDADHHLYFKKNIRPGGKENYYLKDDESISNAYEDLRPLRFLANELEQK